MARMCPDELLEQPESAAEAWLFAVLKRRLPADFTVLHGVRWLARRPRRGVTDGEADFLVIHGDWGILVLEVKGGGIRREGTTGRWYSTNRDGVENEIKDPFAQAQRSMYALRDKLADAPTTNPFQYPLARAVWLPDCRVPSGHLGPDIPRELVLDMDDLGDPTRAVERAFAHQLGANVGITPDPGDGVATVVQLLAPSWTTTAPRLGEVLARETEELQRLTERQFQVLTLLSRQRRAKISGCAGSGKTFIAMEKARRLAREGFRVLYTCFNRNLASWVQRELVDSNITVRTFHSLCHRLIQEAGLELPTTGARPDYDQYPEVLLDALTLLPHQRFDAILVDEGQDFQEEWWIPIYDLLADSRRGIIYVFYDDNQRIYSDAGTGFPTDLTGPFPLTENCRNTRAIHRLVMEYYRGEDGTSPECHGPMGREALVLTVDSPASEYDALRRLLHQLIQEDRVPTTDIIILTLIGEDRSQWVEGTRMGNVQLTWSLEPGSNQVACSTIHAFKGLERPVVILTELHDVYPDQREPLLYVGYSRARNQLAVLDPYQK